jgi:hypothetical protein
MKIFVAAALLATASAAQPQPLTIRTGESWLFTVKSGQPADARKAEPTAKPRKGEIMATVRALFGTTLIVTNNSAVTYSYNAEVLPGKNVAAVRTCKLPSGGKPVLEQWEQKAEAVRISNFRAAGTEGQC